MTTWDLMRNPSAVSEPKQATVACYLCIEMLKLTIKLFAERNCSWR